MSGKFRWPFNKAQYENNYNCNTRNFVAFQIVS